MRILFTTFPSASHHFPMVPLAWAFRTAGHDVRVASTPALTEAVLHSGLPAVVVGHDIDLVGTAKQGNLASWYDQERWPPDWPVHYEKLNADQLGLLESLGRRQAGIADAMLGDLVEFARGWRPDLVVHDSVSLAGPVVAQVLGVPSVSHQTGAPGLQRLEVRGIPPEPLPEYEQLYRRFGAEVRIWPTAWVDPCPPSMRYPADVPCHPMRYVPYNGPGILPGDLLAAGERPRVCVTWGKTTARLIGEHAQDMFRQAIDVICELEVEVVVATTTAQLGLLGDLPSRARPVTSVPLHMLLPTCSAIVHHAGAGTTLTAAAAGVPQLTITRKPEPELTGGRLAASGAGRHLLYSELAADPASANVIHTEMVKLLQEVSYREAALRLQAEIAAQPAPAEIVSSLETLAGSIADIA